MNAKKMVVFVLAAVALGVFVGRANAALLAPYVDNVSSENVLGIDRDADHTIDGRGMSGIGKPDDHANVFVALLPYIEQQALFDACDFTQNTPHNSVLPGGQPVHEVWISALLCPSAQGKKDFLGGSIDYETYQKLGDRRDGRPIGPY